MANPIVLTQSRAIPVAPEVAFARTLPMPLPTLFKRWFGPIPPIKAVRDQAGSWEHPGETRIIALVGGGTMRETLTEVDAPDSFSYTLTAITGPLAGLSSSVEGAWVFTPQGTGTRVTWRWTLHRKSALAAPALVVFARVWHGYARQSLESLSDYLLR